MKYASLLLLGLGLSGAYAQDHAHDMGDMSGMDHGHDMGSGGDHGSGSGGLNPVPADAFVEPSINGEYAPAKVLTPGGRHVTHKYGPFKLGGGEMIPNRPQSNLQKPCSNCYIVAIQAGLRYADGTVANTDTGAWLHHMVLYARGRGRSDLTCGGRLGIMPQRIYAGGNERATSRMNHKYKYGIYLGADDSLSMLYDLMNEDTQAKTLYLTLTYEYVEGTAAQGYKAAQMAWLDLTGCGTSEYPAREGQYEVKSQGWTSTVNGRLLEATGHLHNGGIESIIYKNGQPICVSKQLYNTKPGYGGMAGGHGGHKKKRDGGKHNISDATSCIDFGTVKVGDKLVIGAKYDTTKYPLDADHHGGSNKPAPIMGISRVYIGS